MRNRFRPLGKRAGRGVIIGLGAVGALVALDAFALFVFLMFATTFGASLGPYIGLLSFVVAPLIMVMGSALAWAGYEAWLERPEEPHSAHEPAGEDAGDGRHAHA